MKSARLRYSSKCSSAMVMIYPDDDARGAGLSDFRTGGVRGDWVRLGIILPIATTDPLRSS